MKFKEVRRSELTDKTIYPNINKGKIILSDNKGFEHHFDSFVHIIRGDNEYLIKINMTEISKELYMSNNYFCRVCRSAIEKFKIPYDYERTNNKFDIIIHKIID